MDAFGNDINVRAAHPRNVRLLLAQQDRYSRAKTWGGVRTVTEAALVAVGFAVGLAPTMQSWGLLVIAIATLCLALASPYLDALEERNRFLAANIQEQFDLDVLALPPNPVLSQTVAPEDVEASVGGREWTDPVPWYPDVRLLPPLVGALICQRGNLIWDERARKLYVWLLRATLGLLVVIVVSVATFADIGTQAFLVAVFMPLAPAVQQLIRSARAHQRAADEKEALRTDVEQLWAKAKARGKVGLTELRLLQDRLLLLRRSQPPVPDWFQKWVKRRYDAEQVAAAKDFQEQWDRARGVTAV